MKKRLKILFLTAVIAIIFSSFSFASAEIDLGIRPSNIELNLFVNEQKCTDITLFSSYKNVNATGIDKWSDEPYPTDINDYTKTAQDLNLEVTYPKSVTIKKEATNQFCITPGKTGIYNGMLAYKKQENETIKITSYIKISVTEKNVIKARITGSTTSATNLESYALPLLLSTFVFIIIFVYLSILNRKLKRKRKEKEEQLKKEQEAQQAAISETAVKTSRRKRAK